MRDPAERLFKRGPRSWPWIERCNELHPSIAKECREHQCECSAQPKNAKPYGRGRF